MGKGSLTGLRPTSSPVPVTMATFLAGIPPPWYAGSHDGEWNRSFLHALADQTDRRI